YQQSDQQSDQRNGTFGGSRRAVRRSLGPRPCRTASVAWLVALEIHLYLRAYGFGSAVCAVDFPAWRSLGESGRENTTSLHCVQCELAAARRQPRGQGVLP